MSVFLTARERKDWIVEPSGTPHAGAYRITFKRGGPFVPVRLSFAQPAGMDRSPRWILKVGFQERHAFDPSELPEIAGEPVDDGQYFDLLTDAGWRDEWSDQNEFNALYR